MNKNKLYVILFSIFSQFSFSLIGNLLFSELFAIIYILCNYSKYNTLNRFKLFKQTLILLLLIIFVQIVSDIYNNTGFYSFTRGWSVLFFAIISTTAFTMLLSENIKYIFYYLGVLFFLNLFFRKEPLDFSIIDSNSNYFKIRYIPFLVPLVILISTFIYKKNKQFISIILILIFSLICLKYDARSSGLVFLFSSITLFFIRYNIKFTKIKILFTIILLYFFYCFYAYLVLNKSIGGSNGFIQLSKSSNPYNPFQLLYYGRGELPVLFNAIIDKPLLGHGSWGKDVGGRYSILSAYLMGNKSINFSYYIRAHSILFGYFAYAGVFAFILLIFLFTNLFKSAYVLIKLNIPRFYLPFLVYSIYNMLWHLLFSPIGLMRLEFPIFASLIITISYNYNKYEK